MSAGTYKRKIFKVAIAAWAATVLGGSFSPLATMRNASSGNGR
jgi:hypothetical protein